MRPTRLRFEALEERLFLSTYYVDAQGGNDLQSVGSLDQPFATISRAVKFAASGDTVAIREGVYREQVELIRSGMEGSPITFEAYNGEQVLITTTERLTSWTQHSGNIYTANFDAAVRGRNTMTLFVDGALMNEAHWSDQGGNVDLLNKEEWATIEGGTRTTLRDNQLIGLPDDYWNGAFVHAQTVNYSLEVKRVVDFNGGTGTLTLDSPFFYNPSPNSKYLIYDHLNALDAPGEWYFDEAADTLYFWTPGGGNPGNYDVEVKIRDEAFDLNGHDHIHIKGIDFRGGDLDMSGSDHILLQGAHIVAPDRGFGPGGSGGVRSLTIDGNNNIIRDNEVEHVWAMFANVSGSSNQIVNNYIHTVGYNNTNHGAVRLDVTAADTLISHNTITRVGRAAIGGSGGIRSVIQYNDISDVGRISDDGGALYFANTSLGNSVIHHNVIHDISNPLAYGIYFDNFSSDAVVHHNISYNISRGGLVNLPTSYVLWVNNTLFSNGNVTSFRGANSPDMATGSRFYNNILSSLDPELTTSASPAEASNNFFTNSATHFVNATAGDFRLAGSSGAVDYGREIAGVTDGFTGPAPDAGALELGEPMWEFGHDFANPAHPVYQWQPLPFTNRVNNSGFQTGLSEWTVRAGAPSVYLGNAWNYRGDGLASFGKYSLQLSPGDRVEQTISGLLPNTTYTISIQARMARDLQLEQYDAASGSFTTGVHRDENYIGGVDSGEWVRFDDVDFGTTTPRYDRIEIGSTQNSSLNVALRLDDPVAGQVIGTLNIPNRGEPWFMTREDIASVTGVYDLYVVFLGAGGSDGKLDRVRLLDTDTTERVSFGVTDYDNLGSTTAIDVGAAYWLDAPESTTFTTGIDSGSATIFIEKPAGTLNGYADFIALTGDAFQTPVLELTVDPTSGRTVLRNNTSEPITFDAYTIHDTADSLRPDDWFSLQDQGYDGQIWYEVPPTVTRLTELTGEMETTLEPGEMVYLGELATPSLTENLKFEYFYSDTGVLTTGMVWFSETAAPALPGDYNGDLTVNLADYSYWRDTLGSTGEPFQKADGNGDGVVNHADYSLWKRQFGKSIQVPPSIEGEIATAHLALDASQPNDQITAIAAQSPPYPIQERDSSRAAATSSTQEYNSAALRRAVDEVFYRLDARFEPTVDALVAQPSRKSTGLNSAGSGSANRDFTCYEGIGESTAYDFASWGVRPR